MLRRRVEALPADYASFSDEHLAQLSAFYVALRTGLGSFPELCMEVQAAGVRSLRALYAEWVRRVLDKETKHPAVLAHALYTQSVYAPYHAYGKYGDLEWVSNLVFHTIDNRIAEGEADTALLDLILDACALLEEPEPAYQTCLENTLARWEAEREKDRWGSLPVGEVAHRVRVLTNYHDSLMADVADPTSSSERLLEAFSSRILNEADASVLMAYREALRNTYYFDTVPTNYFSELENKAENLSNNSLSDELLQVLLMVDRLEWELVGEVCPVG